VSQFDEHQKQFVRLVTRLADRHSASAVRDFAELGALSMQNAVTLHDDAWTKREERYMAIAKQYTPEEMKLFPEMLACLIQSLDTERLHDVMGELWMSDEFRARSKWDSDVAFTPFELSLMMSQLTLPDSLPAKGYITFSEPAAGTGGLVIACAQAFKEKGWNPQTQMHVHAVEIREVIAHLLYIQLSLLHIPAIVIHGDSLAQTVWSKWYTPAHIFGLWSFKLRREKETAVANNQERSPDVLRPTPGRKKSQRVSTVSRKGQLGLFGEL
jgi:hypothetical protein